MRIRNVVLDWVRTGELGDLRIEGLNNRLVRDGRDDWKPC